MQHWPLVSVVVPVYNSEETVERCVTSLVEQTYTKIEILLVDDGSTDRSPELCDELASKHSQVRVLHEKNAGAYRARNLGLDESTGDYLIYVDADDTLDKEAIATLARHAIESGADLVRMGYWIVQNGVQRPAQISAAPGLYQGAATRDLLLGFLRGEGKCYVWLYLIRRNVALRHRFADQVRVVGDIAFIASLAEEKDLALLVIPDRLYRYTVTPSGLSRSRKGRAWKIGSHITTSALVIESLQKSLGTSPRFSEIAGSRADSLALFILASVAWRDVNRKELSTLAEGSPRESLRQISRAAPPTFRHPLRRVLAELSEGNIGFTWRIGTMLRPIVRARSLAKKTIPGASNVKA